MEDFDPDRMREALCLRRISLRSAARQMGFDVGYLSRVLNRKQRPSEALLLAFDRLCPPMATRDAGDEDVRGRFAHLLAHDSQFGGDYVADAGLQVWRAEQAVLDQTVDPSLGQVSAVAELAEVAGWLCYSAGRNAEARVAFGTALDLARYGRDHGMQWFAADMLAMVAVAQEKPGEAMRLAHMSLDLSSGAPGRVSTMARVRQARSLAMVGDRSRSWREMVRAIGGLQDSISPRDPRWAWWITSTEIVGHKGEMLLTLGQAGEALECFRQAVCDVDAMAGTRPRAALFYRVAELHALAESRQWQSASEVLRTITPLLPTVSSGMLRRRLARALRPVRGVAPEWLTADAADAMRYVSWQPGTPAGGRQWHEMAQPEAWDAEGTA
jgi:tetratricopeptide (TPR) repeat protein